MTKNSLLFYIGIVLLAASLATVSYLQIQKRSVTKEIAQYAVTADETTNEEPEIEPLKVVQATLDTLTNDQIFWSDIVPEIEKTIPRLTETNEPVVQFSSFSSGENGLVSVSGATRIEASDPFGDLALTIRAFRNHPAFHDVFVPSLSASGDGAFTFSMTFAYQKPQL